MRFFNLGLRSGCILRGHLDHVAQPFFIGQALNLNFIFIPSMFRGQVITLHPSKIGREDNNKKEKRPN
jgi:hypothetical protein